MSTRFTFRLNVSGPDVNQAFDLTPGPISIGRQPGSFICLNNPLISRAHARIDCSPTQCTLTDLGSANGTFLNDEKLAAQSPVVLLDGVKIRIGAYDLIFEQKEVEEEAAPPPSLAEASMEESPAVQAEDKLLSEEPPLPEVSSLPEASPLPEVSSLPEPEASFQIPLRGEPLPPQPPPPPPPALPLKVEASGDGFLPLPPGLDLSSRWLLDFLPGVYQTDFMERFLGIFETILRPIEWNIDNFDLFLDPHTAPEDFLPWLQNWFQVNFDGSWSIEQRRMFLSEAHQLYAMRGTRWALSRTLEIYTRVPPRIIDLDEKLEPFTFRVIFPFRRGKFQPHQLEKIIDAHKPVHTTYTVEYSTTE